MLRWITLQDSSWWLQLFLSLNIVLVAYFICILAKISWTYSILISLCKVVFLLFQFSVHLCIFARGCICTVWIFCVFVYFCARVTETSRRQTGRDVEVKRARDIFTSARSWLPTALQDLPYKDNQDEENESCKDKWSLNTSRINERIACDPNTFDLDVCVQVH